jgi:hypothetical protein
VDEIHRVLGAGGIVYAETPFMQQVHEGAFDFARFTESGQRWLFRRFDAVASGPVAGPGVALQWALRYFFQGLTRSRLAGTAVFALFFWLRLLDRVIPRRHAIDGGSAFFFLGTKRDAAMTPREVIEHYSGAR